MTVQTLRAGCVGCDSFHQPINDEALHDRTLEVVTLLHVGQGVEVIDQPPALRAVAGTVHGPMPFPHGCGVVVKDFLASTDVSDGDQPDVVDDAGIGIAGVIGENPGWCEIDVAVETDLQRIRLGCTFVQHGGEVDLWPTKP